MAKVKNVEEEVKVVKEKKEKKMKPKKVSDKKTGGKKKVIIIIIVLLLLAAGVTCTIVFFPQIKGFFVKEEKKEVVEVKVLDSLDDYGYSLSDNDSPYFKEEYNKLKEILNKDDHTEEEYATQLAKLFVIDLYTMSTKVNKLDIGGSEYYYLDKVSMYEKKVMDTLYSHLMDNTYGDRTQSLPEVKSAEVISTETISYKLGETETKGYLVKVKWEYIEDMGYVTEGSVVLCHEKDSIRVSVVDYQQTLEPEFK